MEKYKVISGPKFQIPVPECSLGEYLIPRMKAQPRNNIIQIDSETGASETIWDLLRTSLGIAEGLLIIGLKSNDVVALVSKNGFEPYSAGLGVIWAGGVAAPTDPGMTVYELKHIFGLTQPKFVFTEGAAAKNVEKAISLLGMSSKIILLDDPEFRKLVVEVDVESYKPRPLSAPSTQLAVIMNSSGTTGLPKGVGLTHKNVIFQLATWRYGDSKPLSQPSLQHTPLFWWSGFRLLLLSAATGTKRIFIKNFTLENVLKAIHTYKPIWVAIAPSTVAALLNHPEFKNYDVRSIKLLLLGGSAVSEHLRSRIKEGWGEDTEIRQYYGMTELTGMVTEADPAANPLSVGKVKPGVQLKIVDLETKKPLGPNKEGEVCIKSKGIMKCYVRNPEGTKEVIDDDGWCHTGDIGYYDEGQYLYIVSRIKEMIKFQNWHVSPAELENLIETLPGVLEAGVAGIPHEKDMYHPMALVVKQKGSNVHKNDIIRIVKENLSDHKHLRGGVKFVDSIPRTPTGKIKRPQLKDLAASLYNESLVRNLC